MGPWESIQGCADGDSEACKDLQKQGARRALEEAGVDPDLADEAIECANTRDAEMCAKASAKAAAVYACTAATEGAGAELCQRYAPMVVEKIWPVVGPPIVSSWDIVLQSLGHLEGVLNGVIGSFASTLGFGGDDGPSYTEKLNDMRWKGDKILDEQYANGIKAAMLADVESKRELDLSVPISVRNVKGQIGDDAKARVNRYVTPRLREVFVVGNSRMGIGNRDRIHFRVVDRSYVPKSNEVMLRAPAAPSGWKLGDAGYSPSGFEVLYSKPPFSYWTVEDVADAYGVVLTQRLTAIRDGSVQAVGNAIAENSQIAESGRQESGSGLLLLATIAAVAAGGYYLWTRKS